LDNVKAIHSIGSTLFAIKEDGTLWGLGNNDYGQLSVAATGKKVATPVQIPLQGQVVQVRLGSMHAEALLSDGTVWAWGSNSSEALGNGSRSFNVERLDTPAPVKNLSNVKRIIEANLVEKQDGS